MTKVSIVISCWNRVNEMKLVIASIQAQTYTDYDVVIVDNCSDDGTVDYLKSINWIKLIEMKDSKNSAMETLNLGFNSSEGEYILVMDDDAYFSTSEDLQNIVSVMDRNPNAAIVATNIVDMDGNLATLFKDDYLYKLSKEDIIKLESFKYIDFSGAVALFRRKYVEVVGFYNKDLFIYWNEALLALQMISLGHDIIFASTICPVHMASAVNRSICRNQFYYIRNGNRIINLNHSFRERLILVPMRTFLYLVGYIKTCNPPITMYGKLIYMIIESFYGIFFGKRLVYIDEEKHVWTRKLYNRFFWKDLYMRTFRV